MEETNFQLHSESINEIAAALSEASKHIEPALKQNENPFYKSKYADLQTVDRACRIALADNGLVVSQVMDTINNMPTLVTILVHKSGQWIKSYYPIIQPVNEKLADRLLADPKIDFKTLKQLLVNDPQSIGSAITYARRYSLAAICGVVTEDDDGEAATKRESDSKTYIEKKVAPLPVPIPNNEQVILKGTYYPEKPKKQTDPEKQAYIDKLTSAKDLIELQSLTAEVKSEWNTDQFKAYVKTLEHKLRKGFETEMKEIFDAEEVKPEAVNAKGVKK